MCTLHCYIRGEERFGYSYDETENHTKRAFEKGRTSDAYEGREQKYLRRREDDELLVRVHGNAVYLFNADGFCVTMYEKPSWFGHGYREHSEKSDSFEEAFEDSCFADILYLNQYRAVMSA